MQDHRQIVALGQGQLILQQAQLTRRLADVTVVIQPDLTQRDHRRVGLGQQRIQRRNIRIPMMFDVQGMQPQRRMQHRIAMGQRQHRRKTGGLDAGHNDIADPRRPGAMQACRLIATEGGKVKMAVGVDQRRGNHSVSPAG